MSTPQEFTIRDEANTLVAWAFRNGPLEELHAGVHSPLLENPANSRITDEEMKRLMINACEQMTKLLQMKEDDPIKYCEKILDYNKQYCAGWNR